jgi:hypothetical protein
MVSGFSFGATVRVFGGAFVGGFAAFTEAFSGWRRDGRWSGWREK